MSFNQKDGVYESVLMVVGSWDTDKAVPLTSEQRKRVIEHVTEGLMSGEITMSDEAKAKYNDAEKMRGYVNGLVSNWLRKDPRLNGNTEYEIKNPGSRAGSGDKVLQELRKLRKTFPQGTAEAEAIDEQIEKRLATIQAAKAKEVEIDVNLIPEALRHLVK